MDSQPSKTKKVYNKFHFNFTYLNDFMRDLILKIEEEYSLVNQHRKTLNKLHKKELDYEKVPYISVRNLIKERTGLFDSQIHLIKHSNKLNYSLVTLSKIAQAFHNNGMQKEIDSLMEVIKYSLLQNPLDIEILETDDSININDESSNPQ